MQIFAITLHVLLTQVEGLCPPSPRKANGGAISDVEIRACPSPREQKGLKKVL